MSKLGWRPERNFKEGTKEEWRSGAEGEGGIPAKEVGFPLYGFKEVERPAKTLETRKKGQQVTESPYRLP